MLDKRKREGDLEKAEYIHNYIDVRLSELNEKEIWTEWVYVWIVWRMNDMKEKEVNVSMMIGKGEWKKKTYCVVREYHRGETKDDDNELNPILVDIVEEAVKLAPSLLI